MPGELVPIDPFTITDEALHTLPDSFEVIVSREFTDGCRNFREAVDKSRALRGFVGKLEGLGYVCRIRENWKALGKHYVYAFDRPPARPTVPPDVIDV